MSSPYRKPVLVVPPPGVEPSPELVDFPIQWDDLLEKWEATDLPCAGCGRDLSSWRAKGIDRGGKVAMRWKCDACGVLTYTRTYAETLEDRRRQRVERARTELAKIEALSWWARIRHGLGRFFALFGPR